MHQTWRTLGLSARPHPPCCRPAQSSRSLPAIAEGLLHSTAPLPPTPEGVSIGQGQSVSRSASASGMGRCFRTARWSSAAAGRTSHRRCCLRVQSFLQRPSIIDRCFNRESIGRGCGRLTGVHGSKFRPGLNLWVSADGFGKRWATYDIPTEHNKLVSTAAQGTCSPRCGVMTVLSARTLSLRVETPVGEYYM